MGSFPPTYNVLPVVILVLYSSTMQAQNNHKYKTTAPHPFDQQAKTAVHERTINDNSAAMARAKKWTEAPQNAIHFEKNKGQIEQTNGEPAPHVTYAYKKGNTGIYLLRGGGIAWQFNRMHYPDGYEELMAKRPPTPEEKQELDELRHKVRLETYRMDMHLKGANPKAKITTKGKSKDYTNYYNHDALNVHHYRKVTYHNVYPGIDWVIRTTQDGLKYNFVVQPGADPSQIKMSFSHQEKLYVDEEGRLIQANSMGRFVEEAPVSYQGDKQVATDFVLQENIASFDLGHYDTTRSLIIDPSRQWGTYYGYFDIDQGLSCKADGKGNIYLAGQTKSNYGIATLGGHQVTYGGGESIQGDAFLVKFDTSGSRLWGTYYGGSRPDIANSCAVDDSGNVYLTGYTESTSAIATSGAHQNVHGGGQYVDAFLVKLNTSGIRQWGTYYGGTGADVSWSCTVDSSGNIYLTGGTSSSSSISTSNAHQHSFGGGVGDAFLVKFNAGGSRVWGTYYGGSNDENGNSCQVDGKGNLYMTGSSSSTSGIAFGGHENTKGGSRDAFLVKFSTSGSRQWATYYGGDLVDVGHSCSTDGSGNVYIAGETQSGSGIAWGGHQNTYSGGDFGDAFLVKFNPSGIRQWGTYYGGSGTDYANHCTVDSSGNVYMAGVTTSSTAIATQSGHQSIYGGGGYENAFLVKFNSSGARQWGTYYGAKAEDNGISCTVDGNGNVYMAGDTESDSVIASGGHQNMYGGGVSDAFLVKFDSTGVTSTRDAVDNIEAGKVLLYPNPTDGRFTISMSVTRPQELAIAVKDLLGKEVVPQKQISARKTSTHTIDLSDQPTGFYFITISNKQEGWYQTRKVLVR